MSDRTFVDSNVWLYLLSADETKADRAEHYIDGNTVISVQVLSEVTNVARRKLDMSWDDVAALIANCRWLATEDLQHGMVFEKVLTVVNPFSNA